MDQDRWLIHLLENMQKDLDHIKSEIKKINEFRFKVLGGVLAISAVVALLFNILFVMVGNHN